MRKEYVIFLLGNQAICPHCSGTLRRTAGSEDFTCINCHKVFGITGLGRADKEIVVEERCSEQSAAEEIRGNWEGTYILLHEISD